MRRSDIQVHLPAVRSLNSTKDLHQAVETSGSFPLEEGHQVRHYLDLLVMNQVEERTKQHTHSNSYQHGFLVNYRKSLLCPAQYLTFLGLVIDSGKRDEPHIRKAESNTKGGQTRVCRKKFLPIP